MMDKRTSGRRDEWFAHEAAEWMERLEHGDARDEQAFLEYLRESPRNVQESLLAQAWDDELGNLLDPQRRIEVEQLIVEAGNVVPLASAANHSAVPARRNTFARIAAGIGALAAGIALIAWMATGFYGSGTSVQYATSVGEQRSVELADGSMISLNARSAASVDFSTDSREVRLTEGQALFTVAKDSSRPFRVLAGATVVEALGTKFDVRRDTNRIQVAVVEGSVRVAFATQDPRKATMLSAGQFVTVGNDGMIARPAPVDPGEIMSWQHRR